MLKLTLTILTLTIVSNAFGFSAWNSSNRPELFEDTYERSFENLPLKGSLTKRPWSGNYWATYTGGINFRWNKNLKVAEKHERYSYDIPSYDDLESAGVPVKYMSPAEKYDIFIGKKSFDLVKYERSRTKVMKTVEGSSEHDKSFEIPTWEGLCHAWAPATLAYDNLGPVTLTNDDGIKVEFGSSDVKALLTYHLHMNRAPKTSFLGSRCRLDFKELKAKLDKGEITKQDYDSQINSAECADTNAGAFHIVLTNQIATMDQGFIVDVTRDAEVWNQAVYKFATRQLSRKSGASQGAAAGTVEEVTVETKLTYIVEVYQRWDSKITDASLRTDTFRYRLELNNAGNIIGGEWQGVDRPDFIWKSTTPKFQGYFAKLESIYNASVASAQNESGFDEDRRAAELERERIAEEARIAEERAERERLAEEARTERERLAEERAERERLAEERAERERLAEERAERERLAEERRLEEERRNSETISGSTPQKQINQISSRMSSILSKIARNVRNGRRRSRGQREALNNLRLLQSGVNRLISNRDSRTMKTQVEAISYTLQKFSKSVKKLRLRGNIKSEIKDLKSLEDKMVKAAKDLPQNTYRRPNNRRPYRRYGYRRGR